MSLPFLTFLDQNEIEQVTAFLALLEVHALCLDHLYCCTCQLINSLCTLLQEKLAPEWPQYDVITCWPMRALPEPLHSFNDRPSNLGQTPDTQTECSQIKSREIDRKMTSFCIQCLAKWVFNPSWLTKAWHSSAPACLSYYLRNI